MKPLSSEELVIIHLDLVLALFSSTNISDDQLAREETHHLQMGQDEVLTLTLSAWLYMKQRFPHALPHTQGGQCHFFHQDNDPIFLCK